MESYFHNLQLNEMNIPQSVKTSVEDILEPIHRNPFEFMKISDNSFLDGIIGRSPCTNCTKSRKFFCYTCYLPTKELASRLPCVDLPVHIDIIKHRKEIDGKSTAIHAAILAPENVSIYTYPDIPDYSDASSTVLIFPSYDSIHVDGIFDAHVRLQKLDEIDLPKGYNKGTLLKFRLNEVINGEDAEHRKSNDESKFHYTSTNLPIKRAVFIDSTWNQSKSIYKDPRINRLRSVVLQNRLSQFWRHHKNSPRWYLSTIEAIHQFLVEVHINAWGLDRSYQALRPLEIQLDFNREHLLVDADKVKQRHQDVDGPSDTRQTNPYNGQYDDLFFFFTYMYRLIHKYYDHNDLKAYRRPFNLKII